MLDDLDATLRALLTDASAPADLRSAQVSFETPGPDFAPGESTLNLFLHELEENRTLRDPLPVREPVQGGGVAVHAAPLRVECSYLVTAWGTGTGEVKVGAEHKLLGLAMAWLSGLSEIDDRFLRGSLAQPPQLHRPSAAAGARGDRVDHGAFWTALGVPPRPSFQLAVTVELPLPTEEATYPPVTDVQVVAVPAGAPSLTGRVLDAAGAPVAGAVVTDVGSGLEATTGGSGRYVLSGLEFGSRTLRASAGGGPSAEHTVDYRDNLQVHDLVLPG